jgi:endonuclease G
MAGDEYAFDLEAAEAAAERWEQNPAQHERFEEAVRTNTLSTLDTRRRRALRTKRLLGKLQEASPEAAAEAVTEALSSAAAVIGPAENLGDLVLERVIGKSADFLFVEFFEQGLFASRAVGRIVTDLGGGRRGLGTGFMVSPRLLLTNHHVLPTGDRAAASVIEFNYQRDRRLRELTRRSFRLAPGRFFLNDKDLDFALVAVDPGGDEAGLAAFGWCPLIAEEGKIKEGEPINIVQHPKGELKQVVVSENRLVQLLDPHAHYQADTLPGSSGSPVFNKQWEVVALHHSGVPRRDDAGRLLRVDGEPWRKGVDSADTLDWVANEGIRISRLVNFIAGHGVKSHEAPLLKEMLDAAPPPFAEEAAAASRAVSPAPQSEIRKAASMTESTSPGGCAVTMTVPLQITVSLGTPSLPPASPAERPGTPGGGSMGGGSTGGAPAGSPSGDTPPESALEKVEPDTSDPRYARRPGYQENFLGFDAPFPALTEATAPDGFEVPDADDDEKYLLKYHHYSLILNKHRKLAFVAGVNYDPTAPVQHPRDKDGDKWYFDPRVSPTGEFQAGEDVYADNPLDRGHLVRRADAGWGATPEEAKLANDDTFHFTNCSPQHAVTNQGKTKQAPKGLKLWGRLEDHVASQGKSDRRRLSVFNGPIFRPDDVPYRGIRLPEEFWKVVVFADDEGNPGAAAFVLTQADLIAGLEETFEVGEYRAVQVRIRDLQERTGLDFGPFPEWDALEKEGAEESFAGEQPLVVLGSVEDMVL